MKNKDYITEKINVWLKDYELATNTTYGDDETLDGSAYILLNEVANFIKKYL